MALLEGSLPIFLMLACFAVSITPFTHSQAATGQTDCFQWVTVALAIPM
jgi:hypothetical protein